MLSSLVTGFIFTYSVVVMPGFSKLNDKEFVRAFQVTDEIIQKNHPLFMITWIGSIIAMLCMISIAIMTFGLIDSWLIIVTGIFYLLGVQGITIAVHLPLNNKIQKIEVNNIADSLLAEERSKFETKWNYYNNIRTIISISVNFLLVLLLIVR